MRRGGECLITRTPQPRSASVLQSRPRRVRHPRDGGGDSGSDGGGGGGSGTPVTVAVAVTVTATLGPGTLAVLAAVFRALTRRVPPEPGGRPLAVRAVLS